jgi:hypothetical protein
MAAKVEILSENTYLMPSLLPRKKNRKVTQISLAIYAHVFHRNTHFGNNKFPGNT